MMFQILVKSPAGEEIELISAENQSFSEGALEGAQALLDLLCDEMDLGEGYEVVLVNESDLAH